MGNILLVNITWNPSGWRNRNYVNPKAGHSYARNHPGGESLNFKFDKRGIDTDRFIHGFVQWKYPPINFEERGLVIFYTNNTDDKLGQIVGLYAKAEVLADRPIFKIKGFENSNYPVNLKAEKQYSLLFPIPLIANNYKQYSGQRLVPQIGFTYLEDIIAERIVFDELTALVNSGILETDFRKLTSVYEYYFKKKFVKRFANKDEKEQDEIVQFLKRTKSKEEILKDLKNTPPNDDEEIIVNHKSYKRQNKIIAQIKILRDFKCQICEKTIIKKDGNKYIEAAHIKPKKEKGKEALDNIILLCPNHHKEFDYGNVIINKHDPKHLDFMMNGERHKLSLTF